MSRKFLASLFTLASLVALPALAADYAIDASHSNVEFTIKHLVSKVNGNFGEFEGSFSFDEKKIDASKGKFTIQAKSVNTNNEKRDNHLRGEDFFNVDKFQTLTFESKKITPAGAKKFKMAGDMTMIGVTKPVTFEVEYLGAAKDPWGNSKTGFVATGKIKRKDFGMIWNKALDQGGFLLGDDVEIRLNIEANQEAAKK